MGEIWRWTYVFFSYFSDFLALQDPAQRKEKIRHQNEFQMKKI